MITILAVKFEPVSVAQLDTLPAGGQEVVDSIPIRSVNILSRRFSLKYFFMVILSILLIQEGHFSVSGERICTSTG